MHQRTVRSVKCSSRTFEESSSRLVLERLRGEACLDQNSKAPDENMLFARLYFFTTKNWMERAKHSDNPELIYLLINHFYSLYCDYVRQINYRSRGSIAGHWRLYRRLTCDTISFGIGVTRTVALFLGIRAHTRYDLAEAICFAHDGYRQKYGRVPDAQQFRSLMFGKESNEVFRRASVEFIGSLSGSSRRAMFLGRIMSVISKVWMPLFQGARMLAWREARRSISSGREINRTGNLASSNAEF